MSRFEVDDPVLIVGGPDLFRGRTGTVKEVRRGTGYGYVVRVDSDSINRVFYERELMPTNTAEPLLYDMKHRVRISGTVPAWVINDEALTEAYQNWLNDVVTQALNEAGAKMHSLLATDRGNFKVEVQ